MNRDQIRRLLDAVSKRIAHRDFVIVGSLSVLGRVDEPPPRMVASIDVDLYPKDDPGRIDELNRQFGLGSTFERDNGYYADGVDKNLPTLPEGWEGRLIAVAFESGVTAWFLDPNDAAISKYARNEPRDREWLQAGLAAGILSAATIRYRMRETPFLDDAEHQRAKAALAQDIQALGLD